MRYALRVGVCAAAMLAAPFAAGAADVPIVPPAAAGAPWSWSGLYAGFHVANGWANDTWRSGSGAILDNPLFAQLFVPFIGSASGSGAVAGGQVGYNYQIGSWVFGVEAALSAADINSNMPCAQALFSCNASVDGLGTLTGRAGFAFDQFLVYAKGGAAGQHVHYNMVLIPLAGLANVLHGSESRTGWTAGVGVEFALSPELSAVAEYDYLDFGTHVAALIDQNGNAAHVTTSQSTHLVKVGLNYKIGEPFGWAASAKAVPIFLPPPPASQNWTGVYVGANVGGGWGQTNWNSSTGVLGAFSDSVFAASGTANGFVVGGQIGANYQIGPWVMGVEADAGWADIDGNARCATSSAIVTSFTCHTRIDSLGTVTGRFGETFGNLLVYGKGGAAWDREEHTAVQGLSSPTTIFSGDATRWGWAIGAGLEYAFTPAWSGKVEYDYLSFGNAGVGTSDGFGHSSTIGISQGLSVVKMGFNYKLGADPAAGFGAAAPVPIWVKAPVFKAPPPSDWTIEAGARYWVSGGRKQLDLFAAQPPNQLNSRLTFAGVVGQSAEAFARLDHRNGMFLKGNFGLGDQVKGQFYDEDFAPFTLNAGAPPYSNTVSSQRDGRMLYGSLDVGHEVIAGPAGDFGAYVGYRYLYERNNAFGFVQLAAVEFPTESNGPGDFRNRGLERSGDRRERANAACRALAARSRRRVPAVRRPDRHRQSLVSRQHQSAVGAGARLGVAVRGNPVLCAHRSMEHRRRRPLLVLRDDERTHAVSSHPVQLPDQVLQRALRRLPAGDLQVRRRCTHLSGRARREHGAGASQLDRVLRGRPSRRRVRPLELVGSVRTDLDRRSGPGRRRARGRSGRLQLSDSAWW